MLNNIKPVIKKELRQISRDKRTLGILLFLPAFMLVMFGYALNFDVKHITLAVYDADKSGLSREFTSKFINSEYFDMAYYLDNLKESDKLMGTEKIKVILSIPEDFSQKIISKNTAKIQVFIDGSNATAASTIIGYINSIVQEYSSKILMDAYAKGGKAGFVLPIDFRPRIWYNPELKSVKYLVPGLIGFILMIITVISTALSIVKEKERNTIEQIIVSPIKPIELILGKTIPYAVISLCATLVIILAGYLLFDISIKGSYFLLFIMLAIFIVGCLGMGLLISTIAETQQVAFMIAILTTLLPTFVLSGFVFPIRNMPLIIQSVTYLMPARYFLVILRNIILKGTGITSFWPEALCLIAFAVFTIGLSSARLKRKQQY